jgi:hypothetical protein
MSLSDARRFFAGIFPKSINPRLPPQFSDSYFRLIPLPALFNVEDTRRMLRPALAVHACAIFHDP